jgi:CRP-like cAMP-binding protein
VKKEIADSILASTGWLAQQPRPLQKAILQRGQLVSFRPGEFIFHVDDTPGGMFAIVEGGIAALIPTLGGTLRLATILRSGIWFGHGPLLTGQRRTLAFRASENSLLLRLSLDDLNEVRAIIPDAARYIASVAEQSTAVAIQVIADLLIPQTDRRVAATLLRLAGAHANPTAGKMREIKLNQTELAEMANTSRHSVNRALGRFEAGGWIEVNYNVVQLRDPIALAEFAHSAE